MATFYCDIYAGNDSNDGLTTSTPKLTINAATALVTAATDVVKCRGYDNLFTDIGSWTWTDETMTIVYVGADKRAELAANDYICKTVVLSGSVMPEIYRIKTVTYTGGNTIATIYGTSPYHMVKTTTETVATSKITLPSTMATQTVGKNGYLSGSASDLEGRVITTLSGGWNSDYTAQTTFTLWYSSTASVGFLSITRSYWLVERFIACGGGGVLSINGSTCTCKDCSASYVGNNLYSLNNAYSYIKNCIGIQANTNNIFGDNDTIIKDSKLIINRSNIFQVGNLAENCVFAYANNTELISANGSYKQDFINCQFHNVNNKIFFKSLMYTGAFNCTGCTFTDIGTASGLYFTNYAGMGNTATGAYGNLVNCVFDLNRNRTTGHIKGWYQPQIGFGIFMGISADKGIAGTMLGCSGITSDNKVGLDINGIVDNTMIRNAKMHSGENTHANLIIYNTENDDFEISGYGYNANGISDTILYEATGNTRFCQYGFQQISSDYYTGKTSGTTALKLQVTYKSADCIFDTVNFIVNTAVTGYTLSFYAKASGSYTLEYNLWNGNDYIWSTWKTASVNTDYQNFNQAITPSDLNQNGTARLDFRIPSQAKGTYALIDYIQLT